MYKGRQASYEDLDEAAEALKRRTIPPASLPSATSLYTREVYKENAAEVRRFLCYFLSFFVVSSIQSNNKATARMKAPAQKATCATVS